MQTETDWFEEHNISYLPYIFTVVILLILSLIGWMGLGPGKKDK
jgi:Na+/H+ antiporter NhaC